MTQPDPIQAQLIAARRNQILDAATQVFAAKGFHRATIKDVAKAAGIADGTIYNYFDNKTAVLLGILDRLNETSQRESDFEQAAKGDISDWVRGYMKQRFDRLGHENLEVFQVILSEMLVDEELRRVYFQQIIGPTYDLAAKFFQQWEQEGVIKPIDTALAMRVTSAAVLGLIMLRLIGDTELEAKWDKLPDVITEIILKGLLPGGTDE
ncbi:MAG: TetR/AcrR family transcriptional regulator [Chloroflexota bacterium]